MRLRRWVRPCRAEESATPPYLIIISILSFKFDCLGPHIKQLGGFYQFAIKSRILVCVCGADGKKPRYYRVFTGTIADQCNILLHHHFERIADPTNIEFVPTLYKDHGN